MLGASVYTSNEIIHVCENYGTFCGGWTVVYVAILRGIILLLNIIE